MIKLHILRNIKLIIVFSIVLSFPLINNCGLLRQIKEMNAFTQCEFKFKNIGNATLAGVNIQNIKSYSSLKLSDIGKLTYAFTKNNLPLSFTLNLIVKNPNQTSAAMNNLAWILFIDDIEVASGTSNMRIEIPPNNGQAIYPIDITSDLKQVLSSKSLKAVVNFGLNLVDKGGKTTRVLIKIKPSIMIGNKTITYPGYISVTEEYSSDSKQ